MKYYSRNTDESVESAGNDYPKLNCLYLGSTVAHHDFNCLLNLLCILYGRKAKLHFGRSWNLYMEVWNDVDDARVGVAVSALNANCVRPQAPPTLQRFRKHLGRRGHAVKSVLHFCHVKTAPDVAGHTSEAAKAIHDGRHQ